LKSLKSYYINKDVIDYQKIEDIGYPIVLKKVDGSGSIGVKLIKDEKALKKEVVKTKFSFNMRFLIFLKELLRKIFFLSYSDEKIHYFKDYENFVLQEFIPNLKFDYKVLIFFDKYYVLKRNIADNDFRASGMGNFEFVEIEDALLEYSSKIFKKLNEPFMALDICYDGKNYHLIEYQGIHFGPYTQLHAKGFYQKSDLKWKYIEKKVSFEEDIAYSLLNYLVKNNILTRAL
jgi:glutathione synthase/RimK-type ligase-like ATP-grasp enzyme